MEEWSIKAAEKIMNDLIELMRLPVNKQIKESARGENMLLFLVMHNPGISPKQISDFSAVSTARVAKMLKHLEERGYIERQSSPDDKRGINVYLTNEGSERINRLQWIVRDHQIRVLEMLGEKDAKEISRIINRVVKITSQISSEEQTAAFENRDSEKTER